MTPQEKAVIEAARKLHGHGCAPEFCGGTSYDPCQLANAFEKLDAAPAEQEISWSQVVEGDLLKSVKNGKFYEVVKVLPQPPIGSGERRIWLAGIEKPIIRPNEREPMAIVRRGATGKAMDTFIDVFSSGG